MKVTALALVALILVSSAFSLINIASGNPMPYSAPPPNAQPPTVTILYPSNNTVFQSSNFSLLFTSDYGLFSEWYIDDWQHSSTRIYPIPQSDATNNLTQNITLSDIPEGNQTLVLYAEEEGVYDTGSPPTGFFADLVGFYINGSSSINFTVDKVLPTVSFVPNQNLTYQSGNVTLSFVLNKPAEVTYSIDNKFNMTATGNSTLAFNNLPDGKHNVTIYAEDNYGVFSAPSTISINVQKSEPFPTLTVAVVISILVVAGISIGVLLSIRHRKTTSKLKA